MWQRRWLLAVVALIMAGLALLGYAGAAALRYVSASNEQPPADVEIIDETLAATAAPIAAPLRSSASTPSAGISRTRVAASPTLTPTLIITAPAFLPSDDAPAPVTVSDPSRLRAGSPTRIVIPAIRVDVSVVEVGLSSTYRNGRLLNQWQVADSAAGFHRTSALPGEGGNTVISGHNNTRGEVFRDLMRLHAGDVITMYVGARAFGYVVERKVLLREQGASTAQRLRNAQWIAPTPDERLTLVSCWPYLTNTHRLIIIAHPVN
jgi:sortase A